MKDTKDRELCYAYLMNDMGEELRLKFEDRLMGDGTLATVLVECETDLSEFAEANTADLAPPPRVWEGVLEELREGEQETDLSKNKSWHLWVRYSKWVWPAAALLLLGLNVWQYFSESAGLEERGQEAIAFPGEKSIAFSAMNYEEVMEEIRSLQERIEELDSERSEAEQGMALNRGKVVVLETEKESMRRRIEYLESNYLSLIELANPVLRGGNHYFGGDIVEMVEAKTDENSEGTVGDIWSHMGSLLKEPGVAQIPLIARVSIPSFEYQGARTSVAFSGFEASSVAVADLEGLAATEEADSFAVAYLNKDTGQAILSVANVKVIGEGQNYTVWVKDDGGGAYRNMGSLDSLSGNIGVQLPVDLEGRPEFLISVEEQADSSTPSDNVVLVTKEEG